MFHMKKIMAMSLVLMGLVACNKEESSSEQKIKVGTIAGPETEVMEVAKQVAKKKYNLDVEIVQFQDYATPNAALADGSLDANAFQTVQYFDQAMQTKGYKFANVGKTFIYPMGLYSRKLNTLADFPAGAKVAIPNDPSNEERALLLLEKAGLIVLNHTPEPITTNNITENPLELDIITLDAAQLPRSLDDVILAAINTNFAIAAGLYPMQDALYTEDNTSPYVNIIATRAELANDPRILHLVDAYHSPEVIKKSELMYKGQAIAAWENTKP